MEQLTLVLSELRRQVRCEFETSLDYRMRSCFKTYKSLGMVVHTPSVSAEEERQLDICEFKANLVYLASTKTARATHRDSVSKINKIRQEAECDVHICNPTSWEAEAGNYKSS